MQRTGRAPASQPRATAAARPTDGEWTVNDYFDRIEQQIARRVQAGAPPRSLWRPPIRVLVASAQPHRGRRGRDRVSQRPKSGPPVSSGGGTGVELVYQAEPTVQSPVVTSASLARTIEIMRQRAAAVGVSGGSFRASGSDQITVRLPAGNNVARATKILGVPRSWSSMTGRPMRSPPAARRSPASSGVRAQSRWR